MVHSPAFESAFDAGPGTAIQPDAATIESAAEAAGQQLAADFERIGALTRNFEQQDLATALVDAAIGRCLRGLERLNCRGRANQLPSARLWNAAARWLEAGWLEHRARYKPRGYAGDYELLTRFWRKTCTAEPLGAALDRVFQSQAAVEAVRARIAQSAAALADHCLARERENYRIVSIGSGPAIELVELARVLPAERRRRLQITLLDLDADALHQARADLARYLEPGQISACRENLFRLAKLRRLERNPESADAIVCLGLFDYLDDEPAAALLAMLWQWLAPDGLALVGNFAPHCPTRAFMEWIGNWYLLYRTADELRRLALRAGIPADGFEVAAERLGIDLFVNARKR